MNDLVEHFCEFVAVELVDEHSEFYGVGYLLYVCYSDVVFPHDLSEAEHASFDGVELAVGEAVVEKKIIHDSPHLTPWGLGHYTTQTRI